MTAPPIQSPSASNEVSKHVESQRSKGAERRQERRQRPVEREPARARERDETRDRATEAKRAREEAAEQGSQTDAPPEQDETSLWTAALKALAAQRKLDGPPNASAEPGAAPSTPEEIAAAVAKLLGKPGQPTTTAATQGMPLPAESTARTVAPSLARSLAPASSKPIEPIAVDAKLEAKELDLPRDPSPAPPTQAPDAPRTAPVTETPHKLETLHAAVARVTPPPPAGALAQARAADVVQQVRLQLNTAQREATIQLDPPELGRIAIRLVVRKGRVDAELRVEERATLDVLARHVPELRAMLARDGMHSGSFDLALGFGESQKQSADQREQRPANSPPTELPRGLQAMLATHLDRDAAVDTYA
jgi:flagellar hook-length control protein FliK